jgi:hypothetical protein
MVVMSELAPGSAWAGGWYLMLPPVMQNNAACVPLQLDLDAKLDKWEIWESFDSATACEAEKGRLTEQRGREADTAVAADPDRNRCGDNMLPQRRANSAVISARVASDSACIATDDPRLKAEK